jgi:tetratricopeptide (TPR) repeat protein
MAKPSQRRKPLVLPGPAQDCPCGSGQGFAACCAPRLPGFEIGKAADAARRARDVPAGLRAVRADLTQYAIWHQTNTAPAMRAGAVGIGMLVDTDIANLTEYAGRVIELMWLSGQGDLVPAAIERLRGHVDDLRWPRKILYLHTRHAQISDPTGDAARREFKKFGPIVDDEHDLGILKLGFYLFGDELPFTRALRLCNRILALNEDLEDQLRYRGIKAARYLLHGDPDQAKAELSVAVSQVDAQDDMAQDWDTALALIWCLSHLGFLSHDAGVMSRAEALIQYWLDLETVDDEGKARLLRERGDLHRLAHRPVEAEAAYRDALALAPSGHCSIFLAESVLADGRPGTAHEILRAIEPALLDLDEHQDFVFAAAAVAIATGDRSGLKIANQRLRDSRGSAPYFEQQRLAFLVAVEDALKHGSSPAAFERIRLWLLDPVRLFNRWVMLEPNFFGLGVRVNNILEDAIKKSDRDGKL